MIASNSAMSRVQILIVSFLFWSGSAVPLVVAQDGLPIQNPDVVSGTASVIDADIIRVGEQRVILWGTDAPERRQSCYRNGEIWGCYDAAFRTLELLAGRGEVTCFLLGEPDPFSRRYGVCESGGLNINEEMVRAGMALAYSEQTDEYEMIQIDAISEGAGVWAIDVVFQPPWEFRRTNTPGGYR
jgi:endonuclease YncB( thermonuclease family)